MNEATWNYVLQHADEDVRKLALQGVKDTEVDLQMALQQIAGRQTARRKLPSWAEVEDIIYPPHLNMEQCSSEMTARYKAELVMGDRWWVLADGVSFVDLTGGFGVDFYWIAKAISHHPSPTTHHLTYLEQNEELCTISSHNFEVLNLDCAVNCCDAVTYLSTMPHVNLVYLDPARRNEHGGRTYGIEDCTPNVLELLPLLMEKADRVLLKLSPMLDWRKAVSDLQYPSPNTHHPSPIVREVHIVSVDNECKELIVEMRNEKGEMRSENEEMKNELRQTRIVCVNLLSNGEQQLLEMSYGEQSPCTTHTGESPLHAISHSSFLIPHFLYEPNASIMKAGCFAEVEERFPVRQLAPNSHLFLSSVEIEGFPGRCFKILSISSMNKQELRAALKDIERANISVRNFPLSVDQLRKKLKMKDGGDVYIFATTRAKGEHLLFICRKIG